MPWESIGSVSTGNMPDDEAWILLALGLAKRYVVSVCGRPPPGTELDVMWHDHELGSYPSLGIWTESDCPQTYINACERALTVFDDAIDWSPLKDEFYGDPNAHDGENALEGVAIRDASPTLSLSKAAESKLPADWQGGTHPLIDLAKWGLERELAPDPVGNLPTPEAIEARLWALERETPEAVELWVQGGQEGETCLPAEDLENATPERAAALVLEAIATMMVEES